jgi:hypothetical protein
MTMRSTAPNGAQIELITSCIASNTTDEIKTGFNFLKKS